MLRCLFNLFEDGLIREVNAKKVEMGVLMKEDDMRYELNRLLFTDDAMLMTDSEEKLQILMSIFGLVMNVVKSKRM